MNSNDSNPPVPSSQQTALATSTSYPPLPFTSDHGPLPTNPLLEENEAPLQSLPPGASLLAPPKPLVEMTDEELQQWHSRHRDHKNPQVFSAHLRSTSTVSKAKSTKPQQDISEFA